MKKVLILLAMTFATVSQGFAQEHWGNGDNCGCREKQCCKCCKCKDIAPDEPNRHHGGRHSLYFRDNFDVYYDGVKMPGASVSSFQDLGRGYAKDAFNVYFRGRKMSKASVSSFKLLKDGYAIDAFNVYYWGREIENASSNSFQVLSDGYARDTFNTYYRGKKLD